MNTFTLTYLLAGVVASVNAAQFNVFREENYECSDGTPIAAIEVQGLEHTEPHVVMRELLHKAGDNYSQETFEIEKLRLQDLDLFTEITVTCEPFKESIEEMFADSYDAPPPPPSRPQEDAPNADELSPIVSRLSSNTDELSSLVSKLSSNSEELSSAVSRLSSNTEELSSVVSRLSSSTDELSSVVSRITSSTGELSSKIPSPRSVQTSNVPLNSNAGYLSSAHSPNASKLVYHVREIFRWIPAPAGKKTDRDGLMVGLALANLNVLGEDIRAEVQYRTSVDPFFKNNEYAFYASSPYFMDLPLGWNFEFLRTDSWDDIREFQDASWLFSLDVSWRMLPFFSFLGKAAYRYLEGGPGHLPEFGAGFAVDFRDSEIDTRKGIYFETMATHMGIDELNDESYMEFLVDGRAYYSFGPFVTGASALVRARPGTVKKYDYFYHGGANTFRGHESSSKYLGEHEALVNLEERFVLLERRPASLWGINFFYGIQLVAGLDGSLLWDKGLPGWKNYEGAVYGGIHLVIPALDRIRFEVGYSPDHGEPVFHIGFFDKTTSSRWRAR